MSVITLYTFVYSTIYRCLLLFFISLIIQHYAITLYLLNYNCIFILYSQPINLSYHLLIFFLSYFLSFLCYINPQIILYRLYCTIVEADTLFLLHCFFNTKLLEYKSNNYANVKTSSKFLFKPRIPDPSL